MIGIDTSIVLRYLLKDDPALSPRALEIIATNDCFVTRAACRAHGVRLLHQPD